MQERTFKLIERFIWLAIGTALAVALASNYL